MGKIVDYDLWGISSTVNNDYFFEDGLGDY